MSHPKLIGLLGRKGSGKDTAAAVLIANGYRNVKFAGCLKDMLKVLLCKQGLSNDVIQRMIEGDLKETPTVFLDGKTPRFAMQTLGTEWGRNLIGDDFWVNTALREAEGINAVVTDVRFPNEMDAIQSAGGICFGICANWITPVEGEHESEALIDDLIDSLPASQQLVNYLASEGLEKQAIQEFQMRFLNRVQSLEGKLPEGR